MNIGIAIVVLCAKIPIPSIESIMESKIYYFSTSTSVVSLSMADEP